MIFCSRDEVRRMLAGKKVAIVGSGPGVMGNESGFIDSHEVVVRVNNFKLFEATGWRCDIFYSFFGTSIKKSPEELLAAGVKLCMAKCPDARFIESEWHVKHGKEVGIDFRHIYRRRADWWFCPVYVPTVAEFMESFDLLGQHIPTTGFSAILDVLACEPRAVYLTGFDFFASGVHNIDEKWRPGDPTDPIGHVPERERDWLFANINNHPITMDRALNEALERASHAVLDR